MSDELDFDAELTQEQRALASSLSADALEAIDNHILLECICNWRKVARVVGYTFLQFDEQHPGLPDVFYSERVRLLVKSGALESQGNLRRMRFREVRLPEEQCNET